MPSHWSTIPPRVEIGSGVRQKKKKTTYNITVVCGPQRTTLCPWGRTIRRKVLKGQGWGCGHAKRLGNAVPESQAMCCRQAGFAVLLEVLEALPRVAMARSPGGYLFKAGQCCALIVMRMASWSIHILPGSCFLSVTRCPSQLFSSVSCFLLCQSLLVRCLQTR